MMTHEQIAAVIIAHGQGKKIQFRRNSDFEWDTLSHGSLPDLLTGISNRWLYRPAPEPKLRPWKPEEGVGKVVRSKKVASVFWLVAGFANAEFKLGIFSFSPELLLEQFEQLDGKPCGVDESQ